MSDQPSSHAGGNSPKSLESSNRPEIPDGSNYWESRGIKLFEEF